MHDDIREILFTEDAISQRVNELGRVITEDYADLVRAGDSIIAVCLLRGAAFFMTDLLREIKLPIEMDFMAVSSYGNSTRSSGMIRIQKDLSSDVEGKHVLIVEDIIDSGLTLSYLRKNFQSRRPKSVEVAALLRKDVKSQADTSCKYLGFECPDEFVVGYGLDYAQRFRNLPYIGVLKPDVYEEQR